MNERRELGSVHSPSNDRFWVLAVGSQLNEGSLHCVVALASRLIAFNGNAPGDGRMTSLFHQKNNAIIQLSA